MGDHILREIKGVSSLRGKKQQVGLPGVSVTKKAGRQEKFRLNGVKAIHGHNQELRVDGKTRWNTVYETKDAVLNSWLAQAETRNVHVFASQPWLLDYVDPAGLAQAFANGDQRAVAVFEQLLSVLERPAQQQQQQQQQQQLAQQRPSRAVALLLYVAQRVLEVETPTVAGAAAAAAAAAAAPAAGQPSPGPRTALGQRMFKFIPRRYHGQLQLGSQQAAPPGSARHEYGSEQQGTDLMVHKAQALWGCTCPGAAPLAALRDLVRSPTMQAGTTEQLAAFADAVRRGSSDRPHLQPNPVPWLTTPDLSAEALERGLAALAALEAEAAACPRAARLLAAELALELDHALSQFVCLLDGFHDLAALTPMPRWLNRLKRAGLFMRLSTLLLYEPRLTSPRLEELAPADWFVHLPSGTLLTLEEWEQAQPWEVVWRALSRQLTADFCQQRGLQGLPPCDACACCRPGLAGLRARLVAEGLHCICFELRRLRPAQPAKAYALHSPAGVPIQHQGGPGPRLRCLPATSCTCLDWPAAARAAEQAALQAPAPAAGQQRQEAAAEAAALAALAAQAAAAVEAAKAAEAEEDAEAAAAEEEPRGEGRWPRAQPMELSEVVTTGVPALSAMLATRYGCTPTDPVHPCALRMLTLDVLAAAQRSWDPHAAALVPALVRLVEDAVHELTAPHEAPPCEAPPREALPRDAPRAAAPREAPPSVAAELAGLREDVDTLVRMAALADQGTLDAREHRREHIGVWLGLQKRRRRLRAMRLSWADRRAADRLVIDAIRAIGRLYR
ncbi:hypothetical protein ABPG77_005303 [Micractinium sp. CCAP 211/92]